MTDTNQNPDTLNWDPEQGKVPSTINVLSILTFIGCALGLYFGIRGFTGAQDNFNKILEAQDKLSEMPAFVKMFTGPNPLEMARKSLDNRLYILILNLLSIGLCLYGAIQMRGRQKAGFYIYLIGELVLPLLALAFFIGFELMGGFLMAISFGIPAIFIILYATQLKHLR
jgi:hypothetical protein